MSKVRQFYDRSAEYEWNRLERHRMEYAVTMRALADYLPPAPAAILDIGGGPGRDAIALAKQGYRPTLFDMTPGLLFFSRAKAEEERVALAQINRRSACSLYRPVWDVPVCGQQVHGWGPWQTRGGRGFLPHRSPGRGARERLYGRLLHPSERCPPFDGRQRV